MYFIIDGAASSVSLSGALIFSLSAVSRLSGVGVEARLCL